MGFKSLANRNNGKRPVVEEDDSDFAPPLSKRERPPPKKKSKVAAQEKIPEDVSQKNDQVGGGLRSQVYSGGALDLFVTDLHFMNLDFDITGSYFDRIKQKKKIV
ncbi:hypothetical protein CsatA_023042 [Cannabis sativa]